MFSGKKLIVAIIVIVIIGGFYISIKKGKASATGSSDLRVYKVVKRDLTVNVIENGTIESVDAYVVKSQVEGSTTIISIIPEGEVITQQDIDEQRVIVELDSSGLRERISQQEITYNSAMASLTEAKESLDIQRNQNDSDMQQGRLSVLFSLMDLQKYLGETLAQQVVDDEIYEKDPLKIIELISNEGIGGEALQTKRQLESDISLKQEDLERATYDLFWTTQLNEKKYVADSDLKADQLKKKRLEVDVERAKTNQDLFGRYEFAKQARRLLSNYKEAKRELQRIEARSRSRLAQSEAKLKSQDATFLLQKDRFEKLQKQIAACVIYAERPGMVVYATETNRWAGARTSIERGATVRERQDILTVPDSSKMAAKIKIHESSIDKARIGQEAFITIDAIPDRQFRGRVSKIAPLPDAAGFLSNPDMKVYSTEVAIDGVVSDIRPGMSTKVSILVEELKNVAVVPLQCVATRGGQKVCYVIRGGKPEAVNVQTGSYNESFVQILDGIKEGDEVLLTPPKLYDTEKTSNSVVDTAEEATTEAETDESLPAAPAEGELRKQRPADGSGQRPAGARP